MPVAYDQLTAQPQSQFSEHLVSAGGQPLPLVLPRAAAAGGSVAGGKSLHAVYIYSCLLQSFANSGIHALKSRRLPGAFSSCHALATPAVMWMQDKNKTAGWRPIVKRQPFPEVRTLCSLAVCCVFTAVVPCNFVWMFAVFSLLLPCTLVSQHHHAGRALLSLDASAVTATERHCRPRHRRARTHATIAAMLTG